MDVRYAVSTDPIGGSWLHEEGGYAGTIGRPIVWFSTDAGRYRVFTEGAGWLPWVDSYDPDDLEDGCAGDGTPILGIEVEDANTRYQVHVMHRMANTGVWYAEMVGSHGAGGNRFAGDLANQVDAISMRCA